MNYLDLKVFTNGNIYKWMQNCIKLSFNVYLISYYINYLVRTWTNLGNTYNLSEIL